MYDSDGSFESLHILKEESRLDSVEGDTEERLDSSDSINTDQISFIELIILYCTVVVLRTCGDINPIEGVALHQYVVLSSKLDLFFLSSDLGCEKPGSLAAAIKLQPAVFVKVLTLLTQILIDSTLCREHLKEETSDESPNCLIVRTLGKMMRNGWCAVCASWELLRGANPGCDHLPLLILLTVC